ncbi:tetratricopeptide repeat protein 4-like [Tubulanus polymorphus]|uniref:tetratricopeptide repeat protein 4-like n=1 Tax=Tubulanus polymorphus TaxID=672921 RepID=UPI003DA267D8
MAKKDNCDNIFDYYFEAGESTEKITRTPEETEKWLSEFDNHPAFASEIDFSKPLSPEMEAMQQLIYDENDPEACAENYKEDGNENFKKKKYKIAVENYSAGIKLRCPNKELNATLYSNRAAAQFRIKNYGSALRDCLAARKFKPDHMKAIIKGSQCCLELSRPEEVIMWCDAGLVYDDKNETLLELRMKADKLLKEQQRNKRRLEAEHRKKVKSEKELLQIIKERNIHLEMENEPKVTHEMFMESIVPECPTGAAKMVHLTDDGSLVWPVLFLYPEFGETDFIAAFKDSDCLKDHINVMFGDNVEPPCWDTERKYRPDTIDIFVEVKRKTKLVQVNPRQTLGEILCDIKIGYIISAGTPSFLILLKDSPYRAKFLEKYKL